MSSVPSSNPHAPPGLPPVQPPSAGHVLKLFVVPLGIVLGLFLIAYLFLEVTGGSVLETPESFLHKLRDSNPDVRKRAANDLAQILLRDERLASEPSFSLDLAEDLRKAVVEADRDQKPISADETLSSSENYLLYLLACVSNLSTPVGAPQLKEMAHKGGTGTAEVQTVRRWRTLWALAKLGDNLNRFDRLSDERKQKVLAGFETEAAGEGERATWGKQTHAYLRERLEGRNGSLGIEAVLIQAAADENPFLREIAVFAMNFWPGDATSSQQMEAALLTCLEDTGAGEDKLLELSEKNSNQATTFTREPGAKIRYNATIALARRGSNKTPLPLLKEMLDLTAQMEQHRLRQRDSGQVTADEPTARQTVQTALQAVAALHRKNSQFNLSELESSLEKLESSVHPGIKREAVRTRQALEGK